MRKLTFICLTVAAHAAGTSFAVAIQPVQPASVVPAQARQVKYLAGEDDVDDRRDEDDNANAAANETRQMEQAAEPTMEGGEPAVESRVDAGGSARHLGDSCNCDSCNRAAAAARTKAGAIASATSRSTARSAGNAARTTSAAGPNSGYTTNNVPLSQVVQRPALVQRRAGQREL